MQHYENSNSVMETGDHFKNGVSSKSRMSRGNFLKKVGFALLTLCFIFSRCIPQDPNSMDVTFLCEGSADLMSAYDISITYPTPNGRVEESNIQLPWNKTVKNMSYPVTDSLTWIAKPKPNYSHKDSYLIEMNTSGSFKTKGKAAFENNLPSTLLSFQVNDPENKTIVGSYKFTVNITIE